ncbi:TPA: hypothetical protein ACRGNT_000678, partial [Klebsiella pneumoniae]
RRGKKTKKRTDPNNVRPLTVFYLLPYPLPHAFSLPLLFPYGTAGVYFFSHYSASKILIK